MGLWPGREDLLLRVDGMTCGTCADRVRLALERSPGVKVARVDHETGRAHISAKPGADVEAMVQNVREEGYEARLVPLGGSVEEP